MEVMLKGNVAVKGETDVICVGDEEGGEIGKFGSEMPACDRDSSRSPSPSRRDSSNDKQVFTVIRSERSCMDTSSRPSSSEHKNSTTNSQDNQLESMKEEIGEVREENERLKAFLEQMLKDYQSLKMHFFDIVQKEHFTKPAETTSSTLGDVEEPELVSLSLGATASRNRNEEEKRKENDQRINEGLTLGLHYKIDHGSSSSRSEPPANLSPDNSFEEPKKEDAGEPWPPNKTIFESSRNGEDEVLLPQPPVKKARVSVRARCGAPTMNDGCQWRKYGQKTAKGNPCPRAYYRCTAAPACPVKKQVQRCAEDMSILITTYEGTHNHPLPMSATAMASATSAAASMLISGSSTSRPAFGSPAASTTTSANPHGLSNLLDNSGLMKQFYPPNPSIYCSPYQYPTITIDLTTQSSTPHVHFSSSNSTAMPSSWGNGLYSSYGAQSYNKIHTGSLNLGRQAQDSFFLSHLQKAASPTIGGQHFLADTMAKAIASEPSFQSALAAAVTSFVGSQGAQVAGEGSNQLSLKWSEQATSVPTYTSALAGTGGSPSYSSQRQGS